MPRKPAPRKLTARSSAAPQSSGAKPKQSSHSPRFRACLAISLDGYIADKNGSVDWLNPYFSSEIDFPGFMKTIGATVLGRTTYDWAVKDGHGVHGRAVVLTRRPIAKAPPTVEPFSGDVRDLAARLRSELAHTGKDIWLMGGGLSIAPFHEQNLVDRWELSIIPTTLGDGIPLFPKHPRGLAAFTLCHTRTLKNGILEAHYEPARIAR